MSTNKITKFSNLDLISSISCRNPFKEHLEQAAQESYLFFPDLFAISFLYSETNLMLTYYNFEEMAYFLPYNLNNIFEAVTVILSKLLEQEQSTLLDIYTETFEIDNEQNPIDCSFPLTHIFLYSQSLHLLESLGTASRRVMLTLLRIGKVRSSIIMVGLNRRQAVLILHQIGHRHGNGIIDGLARLLTH